MPALRRSDRLLILACLIGVPAIFWYLRTRRVSVAIMLGLFSSGVVTVPWAIVESVTRWRAARRLLPKARRVRDIRTWMIRVPRLHYTLTWWYLALCASLTVAGPGLLAWDLLAGGGSFRWEDLLARWIPGVGVTFGLLAFWLPLVLHRRGGRHARLRLQRLERFLARPGASERFPHRTLERQLLNLRVRGRDILPIVADPDGRLPDCIMLYSRLSRAIPIPAGAEVSFEPVGLDSDSERRHEISALASPEVPPAQIEKLGMHIRLFRPGFGRRVAVVAAAGVLLWLGYEGVRVLAAGISHPAAIPAVILAVVVAVSIPLLRGLDAGVGRWWAAPQTILIQPLNGAKDNLTFHRDSARLWIDQSGGLIHVAGGGRHFWRLLTRLDAILLTFAWRAKVDPPPIDEKEFPT